MQVQDHDHERIELGLEIEKLRRKLSDLESSHDGTKPLYKIIHKILDILEKIIK